MSFFRITSDGTPQGTQLLLEDGRTMPGHVKRIDWSLEAGSGRFAEVRVTFMQVPVDLRGEAPRSGVYVSDHQRIQDALCILNDLALNEVPILQAIHELRDQVLALRQELRLQDRTD